MSEKGRLRVAVVGSGAVAGLIAGNGCKVYDVALAARRGGNTRRNRLLFAVMHFGDSGRSIECVAVPRVSQAWLAEGVDVAICATKAFDLEQALTQHAQVFAVAKRVVFVQSSLRLSELTKECGARPRYGVALMVGAFGGCERLVVETDSGFTVVGRLPGPGGSRDDEIVCSALASIGRVRRVSNLEMSMFEKVVVNAAMVPFCMAGVGTFGEIFRSGRVINAAAKIIMECSRLVQAAGLNVESGMGVISDSMSDEASSAVIHEVADRYGHTLPSAVFDFARGKQNEIEMNNADLISLAAAFGMELPRLRLMQEQFGRLRREGRKPGPGMLRWLVDSLVEEDSS